MRLNLFFIVSVFFLQHYFAECFSQNVLKNIILEVRNEANGRPVANAEVTFKGLLLKKTKRTDQQGKVTYEVILLGESQLINIEVKNPSSGKDFTTSVNLVKSQDNYPVTALLSIKAAKQLTVTVQDQINNSVGGARVEIGQLSAYTKENGTVTFEDVPVNGNYYKLDLIVTKPGFTSYKTTITFDDNTTVYSVTAQIFNEKSFKKVAVQVLSKQDGTPVAGARVVANGAEGNNSGATNENGLANLFINSAGNYQVTVIHEKFIDETQSLNIQKLDDDKMYSLNFSMRRKSPDVGGEIDIYVKDVDGNPLEGVSVRISADPPQYTNAEGYAKLKHLYKHGDLKPILAEKPGYISKSRPYTIGAALHRNIEAEFFILEKGVAGVVQFNVMVKNGVTSKPIPGATVELKLYSGKRMASKTTGSDGIAFIITTEPPKEEQARLVVSATDYDEKWSDISADLMKNTAEGIRTVDIYLNPKRKLPQEEKRYGPFSVNLSGWVSTGLKFRRGGSYRSELTGKITYVDEKGQTVEVSPDGNGHWRWYVLKGKIGIDQQTLGSKGTGYADSDGILELGAPRTWTIYPGDANGNTGSWQVYIYSRDVVEGQ